MPAFISDLSKAEILKSDIIKRGGTDPTIILQTVWKYFAIYKPDALRNGILDKLKKVQGQSRTWYTGSAFSFEVVSHLVSFNEKLAKHMARQILAAEQRLAA